MPFTVWDFRNDIANVVITPEIRSRFLRMEPGQVATRHSHDLGHEVFLILQGECEFEIDGDRAVLGPGQMCFASADQLHQVRVIGDEPMIMYLSVTPHIQPTHTMWDEQGRKLPPRYAVWEDNDPDGEPTAALAERQLAAARALAETARAAAETQARHTAALSEAAAAGDAAAVKAALDGIWEGVYATFRDAYAMAAVWNELAARGVRREA
jgi:quercetin dioxygenase-like cupin family protein